MPTYRYPVLVWEDGEGYWNACPVETDEPVGLGADDVGGPSAGRGGAGLVVRERLAADARLGRTEPGVVPVLDPAAIP